LTGIFFFFLLLRMSVVGSISDLVYMGLWCKCVTWFYMMLFTLQTK
jgi:hypothetical protein